MALHTVATAALLGAVLALAVDAGIVVDPANRPDVVPFIVGGDDAKPGQLPEVVSIQVTDGEGNFYHTCGGFIIDKEWVLTAGHCLDQVDPAAVTVLAGTTDLSQPGELSARVPIAAYEIHENFDEGPDLSLAHDIALINLAEPLPLNEYIQEATLQHRKPKAGATALVSGWGKTSNDDDAVGSNALEYTELAIVSNADCQEAYDDFTPILDDQVCAASSAGLHAECTGDSGGPLIVDQMVVGIVSWSRKPCGRYPGVFTSVPAHYAWIREKSGLDYL